MGPHTLSVPNQTRSSPQGAGSSQGRSADSQLDVNTSEGLRIVPAGAMKVIVPECDAAV
jgi:hypothetical protein